MTEISFNANSFEHEISLSIAQRASALSIQAGKRIDPTVFQMDVLATHLNGCPLDLERLSAADDFNFAHDVFGIYRHLNRETGQLEDCFLPRFAAS